MGLGLINRFHGLSIEMKVHELLAVIAKYFRLIGRVQGGDMYGRRMAQKSENKTLDLAEK